MLELLITILILVIVFGLFFWLIQMLPLPAPWGQAAQVLAVLICIALLLGVVFGGVSMPLHGLRR